MAGEQEIESERKRGMCVLWVKGRVTDAIQSGWRMVAYMDGWAEQMKGGRGQEWGMAGILSGWKLVKAESLMILMAV